MPEGRERHHIEIHSELVVNDAASHQAGVYWLPRLSKCITNVMDGPAALTALDSPLWRHLPAGFFPASVEECHRSRACKWVTLSACSSRALLVEPGPQSRS